MSAISGLLLSCNPALTPAHIKDILVRTSTPHAVEVSSGGEVNAYRAVLSSGCPAPAVAEPAEVNKLTVLIRGGGTVSRQPTGGWYEDGTVATLRAKPRSGWHFESWKGQCAGKRQTCRIAVTRPATVTAVFSR